MSIGVIELPDQTRVPGGRVRAGEFTVTLQFARDHDREAYLKWFEMCKDAGTDTAGIDPTYKRNGYMTYLRLFTGSPGTYASGHQADPVKVELIGCWPSSMKLPDYDINSDESDGDCTLEVTLNFDDINVERKWQSQSA